MCASGKVSDLEVKPAGSSNELEKLVIVSIKLEGPDGGRIPCVCLGGMRMRPGDMDGPGRRMDMSRGQVDASRAQTDAPSALNMSNSTETAAISHGDGAGMYLSAGGAKHLVYETDGAGTHCHDPVTPQNPIPL